MEFELNQETAEKFGINQDNLNALSEHVNNHIIELKGTWDKSAKDEANRIANNTLEGATKNIEKESGISRMSGEKASEYLSRVNLNYMPSIQEKINAANEKLLNAEKNGATATELKELQNKFDILQQKEAEFDALKDGDYQNKYNTLLERFNANNHRLAYAGVKPNFSKDVNEYEAKAKWEEFVNNANSLGELKEVDNEWVIVDKENVHKTYKLKDLVNKDQTIQSLINGRQQNSPGAKQTNFKTIEGVPFDVPIDAKPSKKQELVTEHLLSDGAKPTDTNWSSKFQELYNKIR